MAHPRIGEISILTVAFLGLTFRVSFLAAQTSASATEMQAQQAEGTIDFVVVDPSGAAISNASVSVTDGKTKLATGRTNGSGVLSLFSLPKGDHSYKVKFNGFKTAHGNVSVIPHERVKVVVKFQLTSNGPVNEVQ